MFLDTNRHFCYSLTFLYLTADYDGDGIKDTYGGLPVPDYLYNGGKPKAHSDGCNVALGDGHAEWIAFPEFWASDDNGFGTHEYWWD